MILALKILILWIELGFAVALVVGPFIHYGAGK